jgi:CDP-diacylglycerol--glycerol-3-phosphate 3-phosphatidyltransferase
MKKILNLPNLITIFRVFMVPVLVAVLLAPKNFKLDEYLYFKREEIGVIVFSLAAISDGLDGWLARRRNEITVFGQLLDPLADKLLITAALIALVDLQLAETWVVVVIVGRELAVTGLRGMASSHGLNYPAGAVGKWKMGAEIAAVITLLCGNLQNSRHASIAFPVLRLFAVPRGAFLYVSRFGAIMLYLAMVLALISGVQLFFRFFRDMRRRESSSDAPAAGASGGPS